MSVADDRFARFALVLVPAGIVVAGCAARLLPHNVIVELIEIAVAWLSVSVPIGVLAGHCMLGGGEAS